MRILSKETEDSVRIYAGVRDVDSVLDVVKEQKAFGFIYGILSATVMCNVVLIICTAVFGK